MTSPAQNPQQAFHESMRRAALEYLERGWSFFPVAIQSKKPLNDWKEYQSRRPTREEVEDWFRNGAPTKGGDRAKYFNLCVVTGSISGIVILDCDNDAAVEYAMNNRLASPLSVRTTRGAHFYFAHPNNGARYANKAGGQGLDWPNVPGLDFRGDGGYAIVPPSVSFNEDGTAKHQYTWEDSPIDFEDAPVWTGSKPALQDVTNVSAKDFSFETLNLSDTKIGTAESTLSVWEQAEEHIKKNGRMGDGSGRNQWLIRYAGEQVRKGVVGENLRIACEAFDTRFFATTLSRQEFFRTIESAEQMDRRNYPEDYNADGSRIDKEEAHKQKIKSVVITFDELEEIKTSLSNQKYFLDPIISPGKITQIVGYNGHGKSLLGYGMGWAMSMGIPFGPYENDGGQKRVLYLDFEMAGQTFVDRLEYFGSVFGNPSNNFNWWCQSFAHARGGADMNLYGQQGQQDLLVLLNQIQPEIVVIDTVRSAFDGLDEKSPEAWSIVNKLAKSIRNAGCAVVLVHHRNKPGESGLGREAGSTAQLTDIDTQMFITGVFRREDEAKRKAGIYDSNVSIEDSKGKIWTPHGYLERLIDTTEWRLTAVMQTEFGKVRQHTDNHTDNYIGFAENINTGEARIVSTMSPRQKVRALHATGRTPTEISMNLYIPLKTVKRWLA